MAEEAANVKLVQLKSVSIIEPHESSIKRVDEFTVEGYLEIMNEEKRKKSGKLETGIIQDIEKKLEECVIDKKNPRLYRMVIIIGGILFITLLVTFVPINFNINEVVGVLLIGGFFAYFIHIYLLVFRAKFVFRIYSLTSTVKDHDGWINMPITSRAIMFRYESINSISEFSAIGGGIANQMLAVTSVFAWMSVLVQMLNNIWYEKTFLEYTNGILCDQCERKIVNIFAGQSGVSTVFELIGTLGLVIIGIFEYDPFSRFLRWSHMIGVYLGFCCPIGFLIQQAWEKNKNNESTFGEKSSWGLIASIVLIVIAIIFLFIWQLKFNRESDKLTEKFKTKKPNNIDKLRKDVSWLSKCNVFTESITLICGALTLCLWLFNYNDLYPVFYKDKSNVNNFPQKLPDGGPHVYYFNYITEQYKCNNATVYPNCN